MDKYPKDFTLDRHLDCWKNARKNQETVMFKILPKVIVAILSPLQESPDHTAIKPLLEQNNAEMMVRSHHPAVDRLLVAAANDLQSGYDKDKYDKGKYDKDSSNKDKDRKDSKQGKDKDKDKDRKDSKHSKDKHDYDK